MTPEGVMGAILLTVASLAIVLLVAQKGRSTVAAVTSFGVHLVISIWLYLSVGLWAPDASYYDLQAGNISDNWSGASTGAPVLSAGKEAWPLVLGAVYFLFGHHPFLGLVVNCLFCALTVIIVGSTARLMGGNTRVAVWLTALFPPFLLWGSLLLREALVWLLVALVARGAAGIVHKAQSSSMLMMASALIGLLWVRGPLAILIGLGAIAGVLISSQRRDINPLLIGVFGAVGLVVAGPLSAKILELSDSYDIDRLNQVRAALSATSQTSSFATVSLSSPTEIILSLPRILPKALLGPYPWEWSGLGGTFAMDALLWVMLLVSASWIAVRTGIRSVAFLLVPLAFLMVVLAVTSGNYGTLQRLRTTGAVLLIPVFARRVRQSISNELPSTLNVVKPASAPKSNSEPNRVRL